MSAVTAVLLPGNMCDARLWRGGEAAVLRALAGFDVSYVGLTQDDTIAAMAARTLAAVPGRLLPIGFSMGGIVALAMAETAPDRMAGLVLLDTNPSADLPERAAVRPRQQADVRAGQLERVVVEELKPNYLAAASRGDAGLLALLRDMAMGLGEEVFCRQSEALRTRTNLRHVLPGLVCPAFLSCGGEDALCPPAWHSAMRDAAHDATLHVISGAGHMLPLEQPHRLAVHLADWLAKTGLTNVNPGKPS